MCQLRGMLGQLDNTDMNYKYALIATQRSGHHAILNWFFTQHPNKIKFFNNLFIYKHREPKLFMLIKRGNSKKNYQGKDPSLNAFNSESILPEHVYELTKKQEDIQYIHILRDCYNTFASAKMAKYKPERFRNVRLAWEAIAKQIVENNVSHILYNKWFTSKEYREEKCDEFGLIKGDGGLMNVQSYGGGSSFDKLKFNKNAQSMDVLNRYKKYDSETNKDFIELFTKPIVELNSKIFDMDYPFTSYP